MAAISRILQQMTDTDSRSKYRSAWWTRYFSGELAYFWPAQLDHYQPDAAGYQWISRSGVFDIAATDSEHRELHTAVAAYIWGVGFNSRRSIRWLVRAFPHNRDTVEDNLRRSSEILAADGAVTAYEAMRPGGSAYSKYMGPAYFTKYLFFTGYRDPDAELRPLILDKRVATALRNRGVFGPRARDTDWPGELYGRYLEYCHEQNPGNPEAVEVDLFNEGRA